MVRTDLHMGRGKIAVQVAHASLQAAEIASQRFRDWYQAWRLTGQAKVAVKVGSLDDLLRVKDEAEKAGLPVALIEDKGLTQIPSGSKTCVAIGPAPSSRIDPITGRLKLL